MRLAFSFPSASLLLAIAASPLISNEGSPSNFVSAFAPSQPSLIQPSSIARSSSSSTQLEMCGLIAVIDDVWKIEQSSSSNKSSIPLLDYINDDGTHDNDSDAILSKTTKILHHRGPDGMTVSSGVLGSTENKKNSARWAMGHTRLAIVDPNNRNADMPFQLDFEETLTSDKKTIKLAANGEIYNHEKLYNELVQTHGWDQERISGSDCEVIAHSFAKLGGPETAKKLDGMFAFVIFEEDGETGDVQLFAARDPVGIKPLYYGRTLDDNNDNSMGGFMFSSELKTLVGHVDPDSVQLIPAGHYWTPEEGLVCFYNPDWLRKDDYSPWEEQGHSISDDEIREAFTKAVEKRMMADVDYGFFLSGGIDSAVVAHVLMPLWRKIQDEQGGEIQRLKTFTVGMRDSPDVMAAKGVVEGLGGEKYIDHKIRYFTPEEVFDKIPEIIYHMETYEAELIRSSIPNWFLAEHAAKDVKMVLTGEGADELFAGYLYFQDAESSKQLQNELRRIYGMLGNINLHRTDRMTMAHGLEARVPFLDTEFSKMIMSVDPAKKVVDPEAVKSNARGREKTMLRELFEGPNDNGDNIPNPVLWRAKAMQCEGVGEDWVSILQNKISALVSDEEMAEAASRFPLNPPQTKEELYYRNIFEERFEGMAHVVNLWEGGGRAMGAEWKSDLYTREGLKDVNLLSHALQEKSTVLAATAITESPKKKNARKTGFGFSGPSARTFKTSLSSTASSIESVDPLSQAETAAEEAILRAKKFGYTDFASLLTTGSDDRSIILDTGSNKYHIQPRPVDKSHIFRGSCTGNPPTARGFAAAEDLYSNKLKDCNKEDLDEAVKDIFRDQRSHLEAILELPKGTEIILCPSGSDAEYLPVAIARALNPDAEIVNGVSQLNEIGAGSAPASLGQFFNEYVPLYGKLDTNDVSSTLAGFDNVDGITVTARVDDGTVNDSTLKMNEFRDHAIDNGKFPIIHGVFGGKTGIRDEVMPPSLQEGDLSLGVVDACQGRFSLEELHGWLKQDSIVLFTGSKFYQAPTFCGAVIIPPTIATKLAESNSTPVEMLGTMGLGGFLTDKELPECMDSWKPFLRKANANNIGLALRWEAGLAGMEALRSVSDDQRIAMVDEWAASVKKMVQDKSPLLDAWSVERSIISIRISKENESQSWLGMDEARDLYRWMSMDVSFLVSEEDATVEERMALSKIVYIGQPVNVSKSHAIVRIALGVDSLLSYIEDKENTLKGDEAIVQKLAAIAKHFETFKASGL
jgi:asparagine synthase (glutamine-hydrolysing)